MPKAPRRKKKTSGRKPAVRKKARAKKKRASDSPTRKRRKRRKAGEPVEGTPVPHSALLAQKTIPEMKKGKGDGVPSFRDRYVEAILLGMKKQERAHYSGCDPSTPREFMALGLEDLSAGRETLFSTFYIEVRQAETERIALGLKTIQRARVAGDWHAARFELSLAGYVAPQKIEHSGTIKNGNYEQDDQDADCGG